MLCLRSEVNKKLRYFEKDGLVFRYVCRHLTRFLINDKSCEMGKGVGDFKVM